MNGAWIKESQDEGSAKDVINDRAERIKVWLKQNAPESQREQKHLDAGTPEQVYWHYGYMVALRDALDLLNRKPDTVDTSNQS